jgi:glycosyltransferase involved in cell wall biosynthesis
VNAPPNVRILAIMEAASVTGPAKNLIGFCQWLRTPEGARTGLSVAIATFDRNTRTSESDSFVGTARAAGVETFIVSERYRFDPGVIPQLCRIAAAVKPQIIQTHNNKSHFLVRSAHALRRERFWFAFQHGDTHTDLKQRLYNQVDRLTLRSADRVISVCRAFVPRLVAIGVKPERVRVLHNAAAAMARVTEPERLKLCRQFGIGEGETVVLAIGRLSREKGHADLLRALAQVGSTGKLWKLVLVGTGPERAELTGLARALGLAEQVVFAGFQREVAGFYSIAHLMVLPSHSEGSSNVLLEAMTARVPIVATDAGGNSEILVDGATGSLVRVGDIGGLASAIAKVWRDPQLAAQFGAAGAARVEQEFSVERYRQRLCAYYSEALGTAAGGADPLAVHAGDVT